MKTDILIIGGGPAGIIAGIAAKETNPKLSIALIKKDKGITVRCSEPYVLGGMVKLKDIIVADQMIIGAGINLIIDEAIKINPKEKIVKTRKNKQIRYKKLILATGATPFVPPISGVNLKNVFTLRNAKDVKEIQKSLKKAKNIVIIGGGAIGITLASVLKNKKRNISIIELSPNLVFSAYDKEVSKKVETVLKQSGIKILTNEQVKEIIGDKSVKAVITASNKKIPADLVLFAVGVRSETELAKKAGIKIGKFGIYCKKNQETSIRDIYAIGDCVQATDLITNKPTPSQLATTAVFQGKVAGINAAGGKAEYPGVVNPAVSLFKGVAVGRVGLTEKQAKANNFKILTGNAKSFNRYTCHPGAKPLEIKLVFDQKTKRIFGAQIFGGEEGVSQRINLLSLAIQKELTAVDLAKLNYCAHPELTPLPFAEPIVMAAEDALRKVKR